MISVRDMKSKKPIIITAFLTFLLLMLIVVYMINPQPVNAMMVEFSSMEKQGKHVYVEPDISEVTTTILLNDFEQSRERVSGFFEDLKDNPTLLLFNLHTLLRSMLRRIERARLIILVGEITLLLVQTDLTRM